MTSCGSNASSSRDPGTLVEALLSDPSGEASGFYGVDWTSEFRPRARLRPFAKAYSWETCILDLDPEKASGSSFCGDRRVLESELGRPVDLGTRRSVLNAVS